LQYCHHREAGGLGPDDARSEGHGDEAAGRGGCRLFGSQAAFGPDDPAAAGEDLDIYCTGLRTDSVIPPQVAIGGRLATVVSFGSALDGSSMDQVRVRVPSGIAAGPAVPVRMIYIGRPSNEVTIAVQP
jgi:uncharacterized protein (TIGR03437 family)